MELLVNVEEREQYLYHIVSANLSLNSILFFLFFCTTIQQIKNNSARSKLDTVLIVLSGLLSTDSLGPLMSLSLLAHVMDGRPWPWPDDQMGEKAYY